MSWYSKVVWSEGLFLRPHHFQQSDRYLENLLDAVEDDDDQIAFLEEALDNLAFTEDLDRFELMALDPDDLGAVDELQDDEDE